jgi:hypothetical protein
MRRITTIRSSREASLEMHREELRNVRWARRRSQILTLTALVSAFGLLLAEPAPQRVVQVMERLLGL